MPNPRILAAVAAACALAIPAEGLRRAAYADPAGVLTVCWGHTGAVEVGRTYSLAECQAMLGDDMLRAVQAVDRCVPGLPDSVLVAFADTAYNVGPVIACDPSRSTAARMLKAGNYAAACDQLVRWTKARVAGVLVDLPGLVKRREHARQVCLTDLQPPAQLAPLT